MTVRITQWTLDVHDVDLMARFWSQALGYTVRRRDDGSAKLLPPQGADAGALLVWLQPTDDPKRTKNRNHPDLNADGDVDAEADRLVALGAKRVDIGQTGDEGFVVLADPEGNEFCILHGPPT
jgi:predicted enzyme related to lactoylglutathione lyase